MPNRRDFLSAIAGAGYYLSASTGNTASLSSAPLGVGVIGLGSRGYNLIDKFQKQGRCRIIAVCDVDESHFRDRPWGKGNNYGRVPAVKRIESTYTDKYGKGQFQPVKAFADYRELIDHDGIGAVVVATPDHWHALCTLTALRAGKHVYCEKPVTHLFREGQLVYREAAERRAVFQTGSQQRSDARFRRAVEIVRNGLIGKVSKVEVGLPPGYSKPMGDATVVQPPKHLDYDFWCGPAAKLPYTRARHHRWWRGHRAFGGGVLMDWIGHHNDIAHWAIGMDEKGPTSVLATQWTIPESKIYNTPHQYSIQCEYSDGIQSTISTANRSGLKLIGSEGWVWVNRGEIEASDARWLETDFEPGTVKVYKSDDHVGNFLECVASRDQCIAPAETAHRSITPGHVGFVSQQLGRKLTWDHKNEIVVGDIEANKLLSTIDYRQPWRIDE